MMCRRTLRAILLFVVVGLCPPAALRAHEIVGQVTPLMVHMKRALLLIENGKGEAAVREIRMVYEDFSHEMGMGMVMEGIGLKNKARQIDQRYQTRLEAAVAEALDRGDAPAIQRIVQTLAFLLMLEKFDAIEKSMAPARAHLDAQTTIFWLGRNYFSYLLEPTLALRDPVEEKRLDRLLDAMLYRLEDRQPGEFSRLRNGLELGIARAFDLKLPEGFHEE